jgi:hypothetical protein
LEFIVGLCCLIIQHFLLYKYYQKINLKSYSICTTQIENHYKYL